MQCDEKGRPMTYWGGMRPELQPEPQMSLLALRLVWVCLILFVVLFWSTLGWLFLWCIRG